MRAKAQRGDGAAATILQPQSRFCWRERTEKLNWRLLRALHLPDVVRRGDPSVLEPYVLHLTFARLPSSAAAVADDGIDVGRYDGSELRGHAPQRNAWFIVRTFQLATEYLLFMRSHDATVLETLQHELQQCAHETDAFATRAAKWKARAKSGDKQVQKLHQVLQSIAKLLQIQGATPSAVATIESLLANLLPRRSKRNDSNNDDEATAAAHERLHAAQQCYDCGKMFATADFLARHRTRRHANNNQTTTTTQATTVMPLSSNDAHQQSTGSERTQMHELLQQIEHTLQRHRASLQVLGTQEAHKIEQLYANLHGESQLVEEMRATRDRMTQQVADAQQQLDTLEQQLDAAQQTLEDKNEQLAIAERRCKLLRWDATTFVPATSTVTSEAATRLEMQRLEQALALVTATLETARTDLSQLQTAHGLLLQTNEALTEELQQTQRHALAFEHSIASKAVTARAAGDGEATAQRDCASQVDVLRSATASTQTEMSSVAGESHVNTTDVAVQTVTVERNGVAIQTYTDDDDVNDDEATPAAAAIALMEFESANLEPEVVTHAPALVIESAKLEAVEPPALESSPLSLPSAASAGESDYVFNIVAADAIDAVARRAQSAAAASTRFTPDDVKRFTPIPAHTFIRSRFAHSEQAVNGRIALQLRALEQQAQRYGVPPRCSVLSNEHLEIVQHALHGHLAILSTNVLECMVACERHANALIEREWVPREQSRQHALARFKVEHATKSQRNEALVRDAMATFAAGALSPAAASATATVEPAQATPPVPASVQKSSVVPTRASDNADAVGPATSTAVDAVAPVAQTHVWIPAPAAAIERVSESERTARTTTTQLIDTSARIDDVSAGAASERTCVTASDDPFAKPQTEAHEQLSTSRGDSNLLDAATVLTVPVEHDEAQTKPILEDVVSVKDASHVPRHVDVRAAATPHAMNVVRVKSSSPSKLKQGSEIATHAVKTNVPAASLRTKKEEAEASRTVDLTASNNAALVVNVVVAGIMRNSNGDDDDDGATRADEHDDSTSRMHDAIKQLPSLSNAIRSNDAIEAAAATDERVQHQQQKQTPVSSVTAFNNSGSDDVALESDWTKNDSIAARPTSHDEEVDETTTTAPELAFIAQHDDATANRVVENEATQRPNAIVHNLRSLQSNEFAASLVASSELSFRTSIPSLGDSSDASDSVATARSIVQSSIGESIRRMDDSDRSDNDEIPDLLSDDEQLGYDEARMQPTAAALPVALPSETTPQTLASRYDAAAVTSILNFSDNDDDDSDIEEMLLT